MVSKEDKLILEALKFLLQEHESKNKEREDYKYFNILVGINELLNPKSQEMPFKDTLKEKSKKKKRKRLISKKAIKKFFDA